MKKISVVVSSFGMVFGSVPAGAAPVTLLCKGLSGSYKLVSVAYQKITVTTPTGPTGIYAPTQVGVQLSFRAATKASGANGSALMMGECGLASGVLTGVSTDPANPPTISFNDMNGYSFSGYSLSMSNAITTALTPAPLFTKYCKVYKLDGVQAPNPNMFSVTGDAAVTCAQ